MRKLIEASQMRLGDLVTVKIDDPTADLWITRRGSQKSVGEPKRQYEKEAFGVTITRPDLLDAQYLYYAMQFMWMKKYFAQLARGTTNLVSIRASDITNCPIG